MKSKYLIPHIAITFSILFSQNFVSDNTQIKLTTITHSEIETLQNTEPLVGGRMGDFHTPELVGNIYPNSIPYTPMDVAWDGTYYYVSNGGTSTMPVQRFDEQFNYVDQQNINVDSRGLVQHPVDGKLYMKSYYTGSLYRVNTDPFDGSVEYLYDLSGSGGQTMFTFSVDGQYVLVNNYGSMRKHDFTNGNFLEEINIQHFGGGGIANTGSYILTNGGSAKLYAHDEQGNFVGEIDFPQNTFSNYGTPSYANGFCFTNTQTSSWQVWDIDDGFITTPGCTDPYADNFDANANEDDGSCAGYPDNGSYSLSFDGVDDYTSLDWSEQLSTYTVSMWVISNAVQQTNYDAFFSTHHPNSSGFQLDTDNGNRLRMLTPDFSMTFTEAIPTYWSHVAVVAETNGAVEKTTIYFNGDSIASVDDVENTWNKIDLGRNRNENSPGNWTVDEVSVWNIARTPEQIQSDMYNAHTGSENGLLVYWKANAGTGTVLYDHTGNANHATINGATWSTETPILYQPQSKEELQTAVDLWVSDEATALATYGDISVWDVSLITDMDSLFLDKNTFNSNISAWDVSNVTNMTAMFLNASSFNQDLSFWDVSNVTDMSALFQGATNFTSDLSNWNVSNATYMIGTFQDATNFTSNLSNWDVSNVTSMGRMFVRAISFESDLSNWDVSSVTDMHRVFDAASSFDSNLSNWDVSNAITMDGLFLDATNFTSDLSSWDVSNVTSMAMMFTGAISFESDLSNWDVSGVVDMHRMFDTASSFDSDLSNWDVSSVTDMERMFFNVSSFNSDLSSWDVSNVIVLFNIFDGTNLSEENKCAIHSTWQSNNNWEYDWSSFCQLCPPSNLAGFPTYNSVSLSWGEPGGCENYVINELPYYDTGSNVSATDDWPVSGSDEKDIAYKITLAEATTLDISTCNADTDFDTKLSIFDGCDGQEIFYIDDNYSNGTCTFHPYYAYLSGITLNPGTYYIVVDGYGGQVGNYGISVEESSSNMNNNSDYTFEMQFDQEVRKMENDGFSPQEIEIAMNGSESNNEDFRNGRDIENFCGTFNQYNVYGATAVNGPWELIGETTDTVYTHSGLENETEYFYKITTDYVEGESEPSMTISVNTLGIFDIVNGGFENYTMSDNGWQKLADGWLSYSTSSDVLYNVEFHGSAIYNSATETFDGWNQTNGLKMWNNCTEGNCDNYPTNAEHFVFQERSNTMQPGTRFSLSAMVWQHPDDALQNDAKFELVVKYFGLGEGGTIDSPGEWWNNLIDMERSSPFTNQDPFETWTPKTLDCAVPYGTYRVEYGMLLTNAENGGDGSVYVDNVELNLISLPFKPQTKDELQIAVDLWESDNASALETYGEIDLWDVSLITDMSALFEGKANFNTDIYTWDVSNVTNMQSMFLDASSFNQDISSWDVSNVTSLDEMFQSAVSFNQDLSEWDVSSAVTISGMFRFASAFNGDISTWNVSNVSDMWHLFEGASSFEGDLSNWDVSSVVNMEAMFQNTPFNGSVGSWNVSAVSTMKLMFSDAINLDQDLSNWDVGSVTDFTDMFNNTPQLSDDNKCFIHNSWKSNSNWPYSDWESICGYISCKPTNLSVAKGENENVLSWNEPGGCEDYIIPSLPFYAMGNNSNAGDDWVVSAGEYQGDDVAYKLVLDEETTLNISTCFPDTEFDTKLSIFDGCDGQELYYNDDPGAFDSDSESGTYETSECDIDGLFAILNGITLPAGTYYVVVDGFDAETGNYGLFLEESEYTETNTERFTVENQIPYTMEKLNGLGVSRVEINDFESRSLLSLSSSTQNRSSSRDIECSVVTTYRVYNNSDASLIAETSETTFTHTDLDPEMDYCYSVSAVYPEGESRETLPVCAEYFTPASRSSLLAAINLWVVDSLAATLAYGEIAVWDVSSVTNMTFLFKDDSLFNSDISAWDISNVTDVSGMFNNALSFNGDISSWDVSSVTNMNSMFENAESFSGDLSNWDVSSVTNMGEMFTGAISFQSDLSNWNVSNVTDMVRMFKLSNYNGDLSSWDVSSVENMRAMFNTNPVFNGDLSGWNVSSVTNMLNMFINASSFNSNISSWDVSSVTNMRWMFYDASSFNQNLSNWDIASVTDMEGIFSGEIGLNDINKCYMDDAFQNNAVWPYEWVGRCQPSLSEIADASILEDETYTIDLEPFGVFLTSNEDVYSFSAYTDTLAVVVEMEGSSATIIPAPDWNGEVLVTAVVENDMSDLSDETSFMLIVEPVDDVPFVDLYLTDFYLEEDFEDTVETDLNEVFKDIDGDLTFEFVVSDENILGVAIENEMLEFTSFQDVNGQTELIVTASNPTRASVSDTVIVTVVPVNDPPVVSIFNDTTYFDEDQMLSLPSIVEMMENGAWFDVDNAMEDLSFALFSETDFIHIQWDADNQSNAILFADTDFNGEGAITLCVDDGEFQICDSRTVIVNPVNDAPFFHGEMHALVGLNYEFHVPLHVDDVDSEELVIAFGDSANVPEWAHITDNTLHGLCDTLGHFSLLLSVDDGDTASLDTFDLHVENFSPVLTSVEDVPDDQGGRVYVHFDRSYFDHPELTGQFYSVFRLDMVEDTTQWVGAGTVSATGQDTYTVEVSTQSDSTISSNGLTQFKLIAFLDEGTFESESMSGYSLDNLGPPAPAGVVTHQAGTDIEITWEPMDIEDLNHFSIYRSDQSDFVANGEHLVWQGSLHTFLDTTASWVTPYFYMIQATDFSGNTGEMSEMSEGYIHIEVNLASPEDSAFFAITAEDISNQAEIVFQWDVNDEVSQEELENHFSLIHENSEVLLDTVLMDHNLGLSYESILEFITLMGGNSLQTDWVVHLTDGHDTLISNEMRRVSFDASDVLSLDGIMLPLDFALGQNYPNPFNPTTKIKYALASNEFVNIAIYDLMGRNIKSLINLEQAAGFYEINWNATNHNGELVPAGMYFYVINAGSFKSTKKMVLLK